MGKRVCPWWLGYLLASPLRRWTLNPAKVVEPYVRAGMTVLEPGPGMGFFTLELARMAGPAGRVIAVDVQEKMLSSLRRRASKAGLGARIDARLVPTESMRLDDVAGQVDFTLAYYVVHEFPAAEKFFAEVARASKTGGTLLVSEPVGHVTETEFAAEMDAARRVGFVMRGCPKLKGTHTALLVKVENAGMSEAEAHEALSTR